MSVCFYSWTSGTGQPLVGIFSGEDFTTWGAYSAPHAFSKY